MIIHDILPDCKTNLQKDCIFRKIAPERLFSVSVQLQKNAARLPECPAAERHLCFRSEKLQHLHGQGLGGAVLCLVGLLLVIQHITQQKHLCHIQHRHGERIEALLAGGGRWGAVPGALLGCVPQCGFSAIASNFYASRVITLGTLMAVYLATSDEAIPLLVSMPAYWDKLVVLMVIKVVYAVIVGFVLDFVLRGILPKGLRGGYTGHADEVDCHEEHNDEEGNERPIWQAALRHTLEIFVFIFAFSLVFGLIVEGVGEDVFADLLGSMGFFQPVVAALVGLIPNCAASVLLTQLYVEGALRFSSLVAGLCTGAGVGLAVLWRANPSWKQNLFITGLTWAAGAFVGVAMQVIVALFA